MTALYLERYLNYGLTMPEINDPKKPIIGMYSSRTRCSAGRPSFGGIPANVKPAQR